MVTFAGKPRHSGFENSQGILAQFNYSMQIVYSKRENSFFVADIGNHLIRKISTEGIDEQTMTEENNIHAISGSVSTFAGSGRASTEDGIGIDASFNGPFGIAINELTGDIYVSEFFGKVIRKISPQGMLSMKMKLILIIFNVKDKRLQFQDVGNLDLQMEKGKM